MQNITPTIVLDGHLKSALAVVRSLGVHAIPLIVGAERSTGMALHSKYATHTFTYPSPYTDQGAFVRAVKAEAVRVGGKPVVYALSDATFLSLYEARAELEAYITFHFPERSSMELVFDKAATFSFARISNVPTIETHLVSSSSDIERLSKMLTYPAVLKPRQSVVWCEGRGFFDSAHFIENADALTHTYATYSDKTKSAPIVQPYVQGEEYGVEMLAKDGVPYAIVTHHRLRSLSPTGGASVLKETLEDGEVKNELETYARELVKKLSWSGPIMVEFKIDSDTREPLLMEINGRFWGSLPLSVFAGVDMPHLYYRALTQDEIPKEVVRGRALVVSRHFLGDVRHLMRVFCARDKMRARAYPKRLAALKDFFHIPKGTYSDVWSVHDPKPAFFEVIDIFNKMWYKPKWK